jgi:hypothetical protein
MYQAPKTGCGKLPNDMPGILPSQNAKECTDDQQMRSGRLIKR